MSESRGHRFRHVARMDESVSRVVSRIPESSADGAMLRLTRSANTGGLWLAVAAALAVRPGPPRRAALRGVIALGGTSFAVNLVLKTLIPRRRPPAELMPLGRRLVNAPISSSFPSGHSANAAAFATAVALESPRAALAVAPVAAAVAYSRIHTGAHWPSDVLVGAAVGTGVALTTRRWWPIRESDEADAHAVHDAPVLAEGKGLLLLINPRSGDAAYDPTADIAEAMPAATLLQTAPGRDAIDQLQEALDPSIVAVGAAGGDGTIAAAAAVAISNKLPLVVVPTGTLNHFARDLGVYDLREVVDATGTGEAVEVDVATVEFDTPDGPRTHHLINTASIGVYPELVRLREKWEDRWGKWPAFAAALVVTLRRAEPIRARIDDRWHDLWFLFVGNGPYHPHGAVPAFRSRLDEGLLDVRWLRADVRFSRTRAVLALMVAAIGHSRVYGERQMRELTVALDAPAPVAADGEVVGTSRTLRFTIAGRVPAYRRDEDNPRWENRARPHHRRPLAWLTDRRR
ncbi:bifunctional phosphatase PAP2/diacylglycerol kinase family protein [Nocardia mangyaensis]|uniref:bifunctional phosphatase PAP2/diacylglycerol kinase family protein n=1 Tax=Nocardia mangyaensis TaxID=2213200 RepID=UPI002675DA0D|nr:bifunctional phosphatase PAP2/diacylglycerol kinase family protein [Nocardia mangyaensis]MDO3650945.1 phosphatase PAP2 family protein [Nocardia mangyaensis]